MTTNLDVLDPDLARAEDRVCATTDYFAFVLAASTYAMPAAAIERIVIGHRIVPVPTTPAHVCGVIHVGGRIVAIIDLAMVLGIECPPGDARRIVLASARGYTFGFPVDEALGLWLAGTPAPTLDDGPLVRGRIERADTPAIATAAPSAIVLDADAILDRVREGKR